MTRGQKRSLVRRVHSWIGVVAAVLVLVAAGSGILLQHPTWFGSEADTALCLAVDPTTPTRMLRGTSWGVEVSEDGGNKWRETPMLAPPRDVARIVFAPTADHVYAMGSQSLVWSFDGGRIWQDLPGPAAERLLGARFLDLTVAPDGTLGLLTTAGQYQRPPAGPWRAVGEPVTPQVDRGQWIHDLHTGYLFGTWGRRVVEYGGWSLVLLTLTGLVLSSRARTRRSR